MAEPFVTRRFADQYVRVIKFERPGSRNVARRYDCTVHWESSDFGDRLREVILLAVDSAR